MSNPEFLSFNGRIVPYAEAKVHVLTPGLKYGAGVFEGIRGYWNAQREEMYIFRLKEHLDRLQYSMRVMRYDHDLTSDMVEAALIEVIRANKLREDVHIRPMVWVDGDGDMAASGPIGWMVAALPRPPSRLVRDGLHCAVSSWQRIADNSTPARVKATSNYTNSRLGAMLGKLDGYDTVLFLTREGHVAESPGCVLLHGARWRGHHAFGDEFDPRKHYAPDRHRSGAGNHPDSGRRACGEPQRGLCRGGGVLLRIRP